MTTIAELRETLSGPSPAYRAKQLHPVPDAPVVSREAFILERCKGKVVLDIGASGPLHDGIKQVAAKCYGIDREASDGIDAINLDSVHPMSFDGVRRGVEIVICGEVLEHLSNPGNFLSWLREQYSVPVIITVPNAFSDVCRKWMEEGTENVNVEHVAYYSYHTLKELLRRAGCQIKEHYWYKGRPRFAEGLIVVV